MDSAASPAIARDRSDGSFIDPCATPMAVVDRTLVIRAANPALREWLGAASRSWRGEPIAVLDAKPPQLTEAATRASGEQRRVWLRDARLRTAIGDRAADLAFSPIDDAMLLVEVQAPGVEATG